MIGRHPHSETLAAFAAGTLPSGASLVLGVHLRACAECRQTVESFGQVGGALLSREDEAPVSEDLLQHTLARLDRPVQPPRPRTGLSQVLAHGFWIPMGPDLAVKRLSRFADAGERLTVLRASPGQALPEHGHNGDERLVVLQGAFDDDLGRYEAGDLSERGPEDRHQPVASLDGGCVCLSATEGPLRLSGLARWLQPVMGL